MAACTPRRLREQDFNCVPNAIGVDLITTIIACTGRYRGGYRQREREREKGSFESLCTVLFDRKNAVLFKLYSDHCLSDPSSLFLFLFESIDKRFRTLIAKPIPRLGEHFIGIVGKTTATVDR